MFQLLPLRAGEGLGPAEEVRGCSGIGTQAIWEGVPEISQLSFGTNGLEPLFLPLCEVLEIDEQQIELYGGSPGLRDAAGLESAVATPQATFGGEFLHNTIPAIAAAYLFHLCQNHPFIDGNKRVGANAAVTFLLMNNWNQRSTMKNSWTWSFRWRQAD